MGKRDGSDAAGGVCGPGVSSYDATEQEVVMAAFAALLRSVTQDGGRKRAAGVKPPWYRDTSHEAAIFSHLNRWKHGEKVDPDSGVHPLVHLAWRALAIAAVESGVVTSDGVYNERRQP